MGHFTKTMGVSSYSSLETNDYKQTLNKYKIKAWIPSESELDFPLAFLCQIQIKWPKNQADEIFNGGFTWLDSRVLDEIK